MIKVTKFLNVIRISAFLLPFCAFNSFATEKPIDQTDIKQVIPAVAQQTRTITGTVIDATGEPVIGANVIVKGSTIGAITNVDGQYVLQGIPSGAILQVSYIGYLTQELPSANQSVVNFTLVEDSQALEEVVVVGYGTQRKSDVTGSISIATADDILKTSSFNALAGLKGKASVKRASNTMVRNSLLPSKR